MSVRSWSSIVLSAWSLGSCARAGRRAAGGVSTGQTASKPGCRARPERPRQDINSIGLHARPSNELVHPLGPPSDPPQSWLAEAGQGKGDSRQGLDWRGDTAGPGGVHATKLNGMWEKATEGLARGSDCAADMASRVQLVGVPVAESRFGHGPTGLPSRLEEPSTIEGAVTGAAPENAIGEGREGCVIRPRIRVIDQDHRRALNRLRGGGAQTDRGVMISILVSCVYTTLCTRLVPRNPGR